MSQIPNLTLPLARLTTFCGRHFTLLRALSWGVIDTKDAASTDMLRIRDGADIMHNLSEVGWHITEYVEGRASGQGLIEACQHMIGRLERAEARDLASPSNTLPFEWSMARYALIEIIAEIKIVDTLHPSVPTAAERMRDGLAMIKSRFQKPGRPDADRPVSGQPDAGKPA